MCGGGELGISPLIISLNLSQRISRRIEAWCHLHIKQDERFASRKILN